MLVYTFKNTYLANMWKGRFGVFVSPGVLRFCLDRGVPLEPRNSYAFLRAILTEKSTNF